MNKNNNLVAVYGSLRKGLHNHSYYLGNAKYLGTFNTEPIYNLHSLGSFPGLKENGDTSIVMEVYNVTDEVALKIDGLEGYNKYDTPTFYDKKDIDTPWGEASVYIYVDDLSKKSIVESGDWKKYMEDKNSEKLNYKSIRNN